jgi:hypothetical protein
VVGDPLVWDKGGAAAAALGATAEFAVVGRFGAENPSAGTSEEAVVEEDCAEPEAEVPDAGLAPAMRSLARPAFRFKLLASTPDSKTESEFPASPRLAPLNAPPLSELSDPPSEEGCRETLVTVLFPEYANAELESAVPFPAS